MKEEELKNLNVDELRKKEKSTKVLIGLFITMIAAFFYLLFRDYMAGVEIDKINLVIAICTIGGLVSVIPDLKSIQKELTERES